MNVQYVMLSPQAILANIRSALDVVHLYHGDRIRQASAECAVGEVLGMPPCKKLFTQPPVQLNHGTSPPVCVSYMHAVYLC